MGIDSTPPPIKGEADFPLKLHLGLTQTKARHGKEISGKFRKIPIFIFHNNL